MFIYRHKYSILSLLDLWGINIKDLLDPQFYIELGGLWLIVFIVFAETGLFVGFFLPGDALLFVTGIFSNDIIEAALYPFGNQWIDLGVLWVLITSAGILGNFVGYWFGRKSGPYLFERKDTFLFKKKHLLQAKDFYDEKGGWAIVIARFVPIVRTFAPIVAGIVKMDRKKFAYYNVLGCMAWVGTMLTAGHFLQQFVKSRFNFDLTQHLEVIVITIVLITTFPIFYKMYQTRKKEKVQVKNMEEE